MSSTYSAASAASASASKEPGCEPLLSVKSSHSAAPSLKNIGPTSPAMMTSEPSPQSALPQMELGLMSSVGDSPAKTFPLQARAQALRASAAACGRNTPELLARLDPATSSWRTSQRCVVEGWTVFSGTWPRSGTMQNGTAFQLPPLALRTDETDYGLLPTPAARDWKGSVTGETLMARTSMTRGVSLEEHLLRQCLPTPSAGNSHSAGRLDEWGGRNPFRGTDIGRLHLNPSFVEEIMGFPVEWTASDLSATPSSRKSQKSSGVR